MITPTQLVKQEAKRLGFDYCGISKATFLEEEALKKAQAEEAPKETLF